MRSHRDSEWDARETLIFCPLAFVARAVRRAAGLSRSRVIVSGLGADAMRRAMDAAPEMIHRALLLGFASGIDARVAPGNIYAVERLLASDGRRLDAPWVVEQIERVTMITVPEIVRTPVEKRQLADRTGASIADLEGMTFAAESVRRRWKWGIVRAVLDGPEQSYPEVFESLVRPDGTTRKLRAILWGLTQARNPETMAMTQGVATSAQKLGLVAKFVTTPGTAERMR